MPLLWGIIFPCDCVCIQIRQDVWRARNVTELWLIRRKLDGVCGEKEEVGRPSELSSNFKIPFGSDSLSTQHKVSIMKCSTDS